MTERPILFSAPMVRAILAGTKTQTRRVVKLNAAGRVKEPGSPRNWHLDDPNAVLACPYGQLGDRLWVRETWSPDFANHYPNQPAFYAADGHHQIDIEVRDGVRGIYSPESRVFVPFKWRPSIHMPRWASRITLGVTGVRVERLQDISEEDALAEGILADSFEFNEHRFFRDYRLTDAEASTQPALTCPRESFRSLWESINGAGSWDANPWVWVVEFRRLQ